VPGGPAEASGLVQVTQLLHENQNPKPVGRRLSVCVCARALSLSQIGDVLASVDGCDVLRKPVSQVCVCVRESVCVLFLSLSPSLPPSLPRELPPSLLFSLPLSLQPSPIYDFLLRVNKAF